MRTRGIANSHFFIGLGLTFVFVLSACAPKPVVVQAAQPDPAAVSTAASQMLTARPTDIESAAQPGGKTAEPVTPETVPDIPVSTPTIIPAAEGRPAPEDWQNWPVVPVVSARARQIYEAGLATGTDPARFSKVGDCQAIKNVLMGIYDKYGYSLRENNTDLEETIRQFSGSFDRDGEAVQGGYNAASVLTPLMSNPDVCEPGETPLECEVRIHNPSIMIISLEVWWDGRSPAVYEKNMRQIIEFAIDRGIVPILSTKADNVEGDHSINLATARLAYEYDLPLWNWWLAAQSLPNRGLDPDRPDGFHISQEHAWPERSFTALQSLDAVWRGVRPVETLPSPTPVPQPTQAEVDLLLPAAPVTAEPARVMAVESRFTSNPAGFILFSTARREEGNAVMEGIFLLDPSTGERVLLAGEGTTLQAVLPGSRQILISRGTDLYAASLDGSQPVLLTNRFSARGIHSAAFLPGGTSAVFIAEQEGETFLVSYPLDGSGSWKRLSPAGSHPLEVYSPQNAARIYWLNGSCETAESCAPDGLMVSGTDGSSLEFLSGAENAVFSPDSQWLAYRPHESEGQSLITLATLNLDKTWPQENIGNQLMDYSWSPDGTRLSLLTLDRSDYSGQWLDVRNLVISTRDMGTKILPAAAGVNPRAVWSADSGSLLLTGTRQTDSGYTILTRVMDVQTGNTRDLTAQAGMHSSDFVYTTLIAWVPPLP